MTPDVPYQPYYCEENAWKICRSGRVDEASAFVLFATNSLGACPHWEHRSSPGAAGPVFWDYHVAVVSVGGDEAVTVWDPESLLGPVAEFREWFEATYRPGDGYGPPDCPEPSFRLVPAAAYLDLFSSDRSHMRDADGEWRAPPPEWPMIYDADRGMNLPRFVDLSDRWVGDVLAAGEVSSRFCRRSPPSGESLGRPDG